MSSTLAISSEESCTGSEAEALAEPAVYSTDWEADGVGAGEGGVCVAPPSPSANAMTDIETTRRQEAKNRDIFFIVLSFLFIGGPLAYRTQRPDRCY